MNFPLHRAIKSILSGHIKGHFGQYAEDTLVRKHFKIRKEKGECLDIGAYHPFRFNNTAYFWINGWKCINVDANPNSIEKFNRHRPTDTNINAAVIPEKQIIKGVKEIELFIDNQDKDGLSPTGTIINKNDSKKSIKVSTLSINEILSKHCSHNLQYVNIDIEGADKEVLYDFDFKNFKPRVFTIEEHSREIAEINDGDITNFMRINGYLFHSRADVTSVYVNKNIFND